LAGRWTDRLIVINGHDHDAAIRHRIVAPERVVRMPGIGVDRKALSPENVGSEKIAMIRAEMGIGDATPLFLMIADFMPGKRHVDAIEAFQGLKRDARLAFAGTGRLFGRIKELVRNRGLGGRIHFLGLRDDIPGLIRCSAATVMPSIREGLSRSVMESLCLKVPVIGTDIRGVRDLLEKGGGLLVPVRSPGALRKAMEWVVDHPEEARAMGKKGRETTEEYDISHLLRLHEDLYGELLSR
jgi:glycosyltransferase involved in cell wall biosynthesis